MHTDQLRFLDVVAQRIDFAVDDYGAAGEAFARWRETGAEADREAVEVWVYCYTYRYFLTQFVRERTSGASDLDAAIEKAYTRVMGHLDSVREPLRFAAFVSVVCKRTLLNHRSRRRPTTEVDEVTTSVPPEPVATDYDGRVVRRVLTGAIDALPEAIREIARMRLLEQMPYEQIADRVDRPLPTVRTYVSKAVARLRDDPHLQAFHYDDVLPPGANVEERKK
ncbi:MAG: sigma-70 family RNA polymerase sigma factor [Bacteroidota bacterium]